MLFTLPRYKETIFSSFHFVLSHLVKWFNQVSIWFMWFVQLFIWLNDSLLTYLNYLNLHTSSCSFRAILSQFTEEQMSRYESFRRSGFQKPNMKRVCLFLWLSLAHLLCRWLCFAFGYTESIFCLLCGMKGATLFAITCHVVELVITYFPCGCSKVRIVSFLGRIFFVFVTLDISWCNSWMMFGRATLYNHSV